MKPALRGLEKSKDIIKIMQAQFLYEKFTQDSDPIRDLDIGSPYGKIKIVLKELKDQFDGKTRIKETRDTITGSYYFKPGWEYTYKIIYYKTAKYDVVNKCYEIPKTYREVIPCNTNYWPVKSPDKWKDNVIKSIKRNLGKYPLYEKFTPDSDPIDDLKIGLMHQIEKFINEKEPSALREEYLWACAKHGKINFLIYLIEKGNDVHFSLDKPLRVACYMGHYKVVKILLDAGANPLRPSDQNALDLAIKKGNKKIIDLINKHIKEHTVKESLNEKFEEGSDPIKDMNIGITYKKILDWVYDNVDPKTQWRYEDLLFICAGLGRLDFAAFLLQEYDYTLVQLNQVYKDLKNQQNDVYGNFEKGAKFIRTYIHKWHIGESLNEKFEENSDPIHDLGIGLKFSRVKRGDIIVVKKDIGIHKSEFLFDKINNYEYKDFMRINYAGVIKSAIFDEKTANLKLEVIMFPDISNAILFYKEEHNLNATYWCISTGNAPIVKWEKYFKVIFRDEVS